MNYIYKKFADNSFNDYKFLRRIDYEKNRTFLW